MAHRFKLGSNDATTDMTTRQDDPQKKEGPGSTPDLLSCALFDVALLHAVYKLLNATLALSGLILVDYAFGRRLVELAAGDV